MNARFGLVVALVGAASLAAQQPVFRSRGDAVLVDVSVLDGRRVVTGLGSEDFELLDNKTPQAIVEASVEPLPLDASILLDASGSARAIFGDSLPEAAARTRVLFRPDDRVDVRLFGARVVDAAGWDGRPLGIWAIRRIDGGTALFDALMASLVRPAAAEYRRVIVMLSDGADNASFVTEATRLAVVDRSDAVVHIVAFASRATGYSVRGREGSPVETTGFGTRMGPALQEIADRSGGRFFNLEASRSFIDGLGAAIAEFRTRYLLRYIPRGVEPGGWHEIAVKVKGQRYAVRARRGYHGG